MRSGVTWTPSFDFCEGLSVSAGSEGEVSVTGRSGVHGYGDPEHPLLHGKFFENKKPIEISEKIISLAIASSITRVVWRNETLKLSQFFNNNVLYCTLLYSTLLYSTVL